MEKSVCGIDATNPPGLPEPRAIFSRTAESQSSAGTLSVCVEEGDPHLAFISHISPGPAFEKTADFMETNRKLGLSLRSTRHADLIITGTQQSGRLYISPSTALVLCVMQEGVGCKHPRKVRLYPSRLHGALFS